MNAVQFDFFKTKEESRIDAVEDGLEKTRISSDKVRRSIFAKVGALEKKLNDYEDRLAIIERNICLDKH